MAKNTPSKEEKERFMSRAIELSNEGPSKGHGGPYGAIIVKDGKIIGNARQLLLYMSRVFQAPVWDDQKKKKHLPILVFSPHQMLGIKSRVLYMLLRT